MNSVNYFLITVKFKVYNHLLNVLVNNLDKLSVPKPFPIDIANIVNESTTNCDVKRALVHRNAVSRRFKDFKGILLPFIADIKKIFWFQRFFRVNLFFFY